MSYLKPQTPLQHKDGDYFYPLTTIDQVIMEDGITRLNGADLVSVNTDGAPEGETVKVNADTLGGISADKYATVDDLNGKLSTDKIVNNFTTTEEGFVADARALKVLNDSKLSLELLWENDSPTSEFAQKEISVPGLSNYKMIAIETARGTFFRDNNVGYLYMSGAVLWSVGEAAMTSRVAGIRNNTILFMSGYVVDVLNRNVQQSDNEFVPVRIYGIKGVS